MSGKVALILDDDQSFSGILSRFLNRRGFGSKIFGNKKDFISHALTETADILFVDMMIEEPEDGLVVLKTLRSELDRPIPILVVSSTRNVQTINKAIDLGASDYLIKPLSRDLLLAKLSRFLKTEDPQSSTELIPPTLIGSQMKVGVDLDVSSINEFGVILTGDHFVSKGTLILASGGVFDYILGPGQNLSLLVTEAEPDSKGERFKMYAAFDQENTHLMDAVRKWLVMQVSSEEYLLKQKGVSPNV